MSQACHRFTPVFSRRELLRSSAGGFGWLALRALMADERASGAAMENPLAARPPHFVPKAKRVIYLFQSGGPSQLDLFDPKPQLEKYRGQDLPDSVRKGQRLTGMTAFQASFPTAPSNFKFQQHGQSGAWLSELLPATARIADCAVSVIIKKKEPRGPRGSSILAQTTSGDQ